MKGAWLLFRKEILQAVRDRRTVFMTVAFPLVFYPLLFGLIGGFVQRQKEELSSLAPRLVVVSEGADELVRALEEAPGFSVLSVGDLERGQGAMDEGLGEVLLLARREPARGELGYAVTLYYDAADQRAQAGAAKVKAFLADYLQGLARERLVAMGVDPEELTPPFTLEEVDVGGEEALARMLLSQLLPYFLVLSILTGAMGLGAEITAGEKERGTLATLLSSRLSRREIVLGKFMAVLAVSLVTAVLSAAGLLLGIQSFGVGLGGLPVGSVAWVLALLVPLAMTLSALVIIVGSFARTQKEASAYLLPVTMLVVVLGISTTFGGGELGGAKLAVPIAGPMAAIKQALMGGLTLGEVGWALLSSLGVAGLLLWAAVRFFHSEKVLFRI
ncbi:MAG: ABC-type Na+ efflux pump, permease component [Acetothermia bacterium 64_32]|nr:MAG: ABC-type Na+ efflux pump, permease component [Acetothermia bacterium 64_32]MBC7097556.1 ABC transporter permease [Candidatus Bipolaricaulota bacterium]